MFIEWNDKKMSEKNMPQILELQIDGERERK